MRHACAEQCIAATTRRAEILHDWVGYRPGRPSVRLELAEEQVDCRETSPR